MLNVVVMVESVNSLVAQAKKSKYSLVSHLSEDGQLSLGSLLIVSYTSRHLGSMG